jgi:quercetin dioxygenase-like cupin family protein
MKGGVGASCRDGSCRHNRPRRHAVDVLRALLDANKVTRKQPLGGKTMRLRSIVSHVAVGCAGAFATYLLTTGNMGIMPSFAQAPGQRTTELLNQVMDDVLGRRLTVRLTERDPGNGSAAHRHPGSHTVGYIIEGTYEVKINDGPARTLKPGEVFYEPPNALHAISRNASTTQPLKYLVIQVSDPTKPATVPE